MKRYFAGMTAALLAVILVFSVPTKAVSAKSAVLLDCTSGRVIYEKDAYSRNLIASTTKIMTALVVCEQCNVLDRVKIPKEAVGVEGSSMYLKEGEILTVQELLYGTMLSSGNDAATALAIYCGGTVEGFVELMNDKARSLGLSSTHFENPHGLDSQQHYSTAYDLGKLASYAMENPIFAKIVSTKSVKVGNRILANHNKLLWQYEDADGVKTGYTKAAGRILVSSAMRNNRRLIAVTISDPNDWQDHARLLDMGFSQYETRCVITEGTVLGTAEVAGGLSGQVQLIADDSFAYAFTKEEVPNIKLPSPGFVYAPVACGQSAGVAQIYLNDKRIGSVPLIYGSTIEQRQDPPPGLWDRIKERFIND